MIELTRADFTGPGRGIRAGRDEPDAGERSFAGSDPVGEDRGIVQGR
jgi:hypothetical protein